MSSEHITRLCDRAAAPAARVLATLKRLDDGLKALPSTAEPIGGGVQAFDLEHVAGLQTIPGVPTREQE